MFKPLHAVELYHNTGNRVYKNKSLGSHSFSKLDLAICPQLETSKGDPQRESNVTTQGRVKTKGSRYLQVYLWWTAMSCGFTKRWIGTRGRRKVY